MAPAVRHGRCRLGRGVVCAARHRAPALAGLLRDHYAFGLRSQEQHAPRGEHAGDLGERPQDSAAFDKLPITPREREVLTWVGAGKSDRQIADILGMSMRTVQKHLEHIYEKLGVETRTAAVMRALGRG